MKKFDNKFKNILYLIYRWMSLVVNPVHIIHFIPELIVYIRSWVKYAHLDKAEKLNFIDIYPCLYDRTSTTPIDTQYFYQDIWAYKKIQTSNNKEHTDVGSRVIFTGLLSAICEVAFIDIRPLEVKVANLKSTKGSVLKMPYKDATVESLSCLHVIEHVGLGRYGDGLDPEGSKKSCKELARVLAKGGNLYISLPIGKQRLCFNAHRVHTPDTIISYFKDLELVDFSCINDQGEFIEHADYKTYNNADYSCGLFNFTKK